VNPIDALILGKVAFLTDRWVLLKSDVAVPGGGVEFRREGLILSPGTRVARKSFRTVHCQS